MKEKLLKYKEQINYLLFGVLTTLTNIIAYFVLTRAFDASVTMGTITAWILSVLFAYVTNRIWVFQSKVSGFRLIVRELLAFVMGRLASGFLDLGFMYLFVDILHLNDMIIKVLSNIIVVTMNYLVSKRLVFAKGEHNDC